MDITTNWHHFGDKIWGWNHKQTCSQKLSLDTSIVVFIHRFQPSNIIVSVGDHVDVDGVVDIQYSSWANVAPSASLSLRDGCGSAQQAAAKADNK